MVSRKTVTAEMWVRAMRSGMEDATAETAANFPTRVVAVAATAVAVVTVATAAVVMVAAAATTTVAVATAVAAAAGKDAGGPRGACRGACLMLPAQAWWESLYSKCVLVLCGHDSQALGLARRRRDALVAGSQRASASTGSWHPVCGESRTCGTHGATASSVWRERAPKHGRGVAARKWRISRYHCLHA